MADDALLVKLYQKVSGCPLFDLKAYLEYTEKVNISSIWKILTYLLVNGLFVVLDMVVGFFSLILSFLKRLISMALTSIQSMTCLKNCGKGY